MPITRIPAVDLACPVIVADSSTTGVYASASAYLWRRAGSALPNRARVIAMIDNDGTVISSVPLTPEFVEVLTASAAAFEQQTTAARERIFQLIASLGDPAADTSADAIASLFGEVSSIDDLQLRHALAAVPADAAPEAQWLVHNALVAGTGPAEMGAAASVLPPRARAFVVAALFGLLERTQYTDFRVALTTASELQSAD